MSKPHALPIRYDLRVYRGDTLERMIAIWYRADGIALLLDTAGWTARMQVRPEKNSGTVTLNATTENGYLSTGIRENADGRRWCFHMNIPGEAIGKIPGGFIGYYDIEFTDPTGRRQTFYYGDFLVEGDVTR